jgi:hypothetical protein
LSLLLTIGLTLGLSTGFWTLFYKKMSKTGYFDIFHGYAGP